MALPTIPKSNPIQPNGGLINIGCVNPKPVGFANHSQFVLISAIMALGVNIQWGWQVYLMWV